MAAFGPEVRDLPAIGPVMHRLEIDLAEARYVLAGVEDRPSRTKRHASGRSRARRSVFRPPLRVAKDVARCARDARRADVMLAIARKRERKRLRAVGIFLLDELRADRIEAGGGGEGDRLFRVLELRETGNRTMRGRHELHLLRLEATKDLGRRCPEAPHRLVRIVRA